MRQGLNEVSWTEVLAVTEHYTGLSKAAGALLVEPDLARSVAGPGAALVDLVEDDTADGRTRAVFADIRVSLGERLGIDRVPNFWKAIAHDYHYLAATWHKEQVVTRPDALDARTKAAVALAAAMVNGGRYFIEYTLLAFRRLGATTRDIVQLAALVDSFTCFNKVADGMRIDLESHDGRPARFRVEPADATVGSHA